MAIARIRSILVFLILGSENRQHRSGFYLVLGGLLCILTFNIWRLAGLSHKAAPAADLRRVSRAVQTLSQKLRDYEAVIGRQSPTPPHGSPVRGVISSRYGMRIHPRSKRWKMHHGVDLAVPVGTPVVVTADGWVSRIGEDRTGWGLFVEVVHPASRFLTRYAHLSNVHVRVGEPVRRGRVIARSGNSGSSTGPHLHYEVRTNTGHSIDPLNMRTH